MAIAESAIALPVPKNLSDASLVFGVCLFVMAIIVIFMVIRIPRLLALFGTSSDGVILRHVHLPRVAQSKRHGHSSPAAKESNIFSESKDDIIFQNSYPSERSLLSKVHVRDTRKRYPPHIPSLPKALRPLLKPFRTRISPGFSFGQLLILLAYLTILLYATIHNSNIFLDQSRTGWIAVSQFPFVYALAQKNNFIGTFLGFGYEKVEFPEDGDRIYVDLDSQLNFLHRFAGKLVVLAANIHSLYFFYRWSFDGTLWDMIQIRNGQPTWGIIALLCVDSLYFFSTPYIRERAYNFFFRSHVASIILLLPATYMHKRATLPYILTCAAVYAFDCLFRVVKTRIATASIRPLPELDVTRVEIPQINAGWRAGQHVRLRVLTFQMGWFGWAETHPFTIASVSRGSPDGLVLLCKRAGDWTRKLYDMAQMGNKLGDSARIKVVVEGPYGGPGHTIYSSFSAAVLIAGGSGITYSLSVVQDLVLKDLNKESRIKSINVVWSIPDPSSLVPLLPTLSSLVRKSVYTPVRINVFYTAAPTGKQPSIITQALLSHINSPAPSGVRRIPNSTVNGLPLGVTLTAGRPNFRKIFDEAIQGAVSLGFGAKDDEPITGMVVGVCGPLKMADDVSMAVSSINPARRDQVGGIEICEEVFGW